MDGACSRELGCRCFAWRKFVERDNIWIIWMDSDSLPSRFYKFGSKRSKVGTPKNTRKIVFLDPSLMAIVPVADFIGKLPLQLREAHHIQSLENVSAMRWIGNEFNIQLPSFLEELKGEV